MMGAKLAFLWTDILFYILILCGVAFTVYSCQKIQLRQAWQKVFRRPVAMIASVFLLFYLLVALLDSIHFQQTADLENTQTKIYSSQIYSLLDKLLYPVGQQPEKTYSAPFALH